MAKTTLLAICAGAMLACSSTSDRPKPKDLSAAPSLMGVRQTWNIRIGEVAFPLRVSSAGGTVILASSDGVLRGLDPRNGAEKWRFPVGEAVSAGVGSDGLRSAVVTVSNQLVVVEGERELWRQRLGAQAYTAPLVAGGRVFVLTADRALSAFDGKTGRKLWTQQRPGEPLVLRQAGVLLAVGDNLVVGQAGRLVGINPGNGTVRWEAPIASPRGTNDVERLVDLVGVVSRVGDMVCARAFQSHVGCVNASRGNLVWTQSANGAEGVHGDADRVIGTEADGRVIAWRRSDGQRLWTVDTLQYRSLSAPALLGRSIVVGDGNGILHFMSREDGSLLSRVNTDGSAVVSQPALVDGTLVAVTRNGGVYGFVPD
jgi:outer membrane assembly lipoprotein YfgL